MDLKVFATIFVTIFLAELGDKTQLATMLFAADHSASKLTILLAASAALIAATVMAIFVGGVLSHYVDVKLLSYIAGVGFIIIGVYTLFSA